MKFNIGERITIKNYADLPQAHKNKGTAKCCGKSGKVVEAFTSVSGEEKYLIHLDGYAVASKHLWSDECLVGEGASEYTWEFEVLENLVVGIMYEVKGSTKTEIVRGHGHIIHEGALGKAQAASYALKKIYEKLGGTF